MNFDNYMNPMFSDMDSKYIYPMPYVNPMIYMNPYMMNSMPCQNNNQKANNDNQNDIHQNSYQNNPMMYMNPYMMNPIMGNIDPNMIMQMYMQMMQMMQMFGCAPNVNPMMDNIMTQEPISNNYTDPMKCMNGMPMMGCMPMMGYMPGMPNINIEEFDEEEM